MELASSISFTTFWADWLLFPIMLVFGWLTLRWGLRDFKKASRLQSKSEVLPAWVVSLPLFISAASWSFIGFASLIREEYWEHMIIRICFSSWIAANLLGALIILVNMIKGNKSRKFASLINLSSLVLMSLIILLPAFINPRIGGHTLVFSNIWTVLTIVIGIGLAFGMIYGYHYYFPRFALLIVSFLIFGTGLMEIAFGQPGFLWFPYTWNTYDSLTSFQAALPDPLLIWRTIGPIKVIIGLALCLFVFLWDRLKSKVMSNYNKDTAKGILNEY